MKSQELSVSYVGVVCSCHMISLLIDSFMSVGSLTPRAISYGTSQAIAT